MSILGKDNNPTIHSVVRIRHGNKFPAVTNSPKMQNGLCPIDIYFMFIAYTAWVEQLSTHHLNVWAD